MGWPEAGRACMGSKGSIYMYSIRCPRTVSIVVATTFLACTLSAAGAQPPGDPPAGQATSCASLTGSVLSELCVNPQSLAAIGASESQTTTIVTVARGMCEGTGSFGAVQAQIEAASSSIQRLEQAVSSGSASEQDRGALEDARIDLASAHAARAALLGQLLAQVDSVLSAPQRAVLSNISAARRVSVPMAYKAVLRTDAEWVTLRNELAEERRAARMGITPPVRQIPGDESDVQAAAAFLDANLASITEAWQSALNP
jgi:hypothetical protein